MTNIQIKNVPPETHAILRQRAAHAGQSLQEYLRGKLVADASTPTVDEIFERIEARHSRVSFSADLAADAVRADRDARGS